jgi:hypothetical protein
MHLMVVLWLAVTIGWLSAADKSEANPAQLEYQVKAGFLFNFAKFVEWPARTNDATTNFVIGIVDDSGVFPTISAALAGKRVQGWAVETCRLKQGDELKQCDLLFITRSQSKRVDDLLKKVGSAPVLTVGEMDGFAERGGCINFVVKEGNVRFEVNLAAAEQAGLKISSKIAGMATIVRRPKEAR